MNILDHVAITVPCNLCSDEYNVPASVVFEGQRVIAGGCPGCSDYECEPRFVATLVDPQALAALEAAWARFEASVIAHGGAGAVLVALPAVVRSKLEEVTDKIYGAKAIQRWETEGGRCMDAGGSRSAGDRFTGPLKLEMPLDPTQNRDELI